MQSGSYRGRGGSHGRGRGGGGSGSRRGGGSREADKLRGLFADGIWHCDCTPRLPAEHFKVKKEGKNQGRWFYTCQQNEPKRCGFFLWDEDAKPREASVVLQNSRSEVPPITRQSEIKDGWNAGRSTIPPAKGLFATPKVPTTSREDSPTPSPTTPTPVSTSRQSINGVKRTARDAQFDDDDDFFPKLSGQEEEELVQAANSTMSDLETPHKVPKVGVYASPATTGRKSPRRLPWLNPPEPLTPSATTKVATVHDYFDTPSKAAAAPMIRKPAQILPETPRGPPATDTVSTSAAAPDSPSPTSRYKDALSDPADAASSLTREVLSELSSIPLPPEKLSSLRGVVSKHDLKAQGVIKGRDMLRLALKARDAKVVELEARIASLEAERECDRAVIRTLRGARDRGCRDEEESQL